MHDFIVKYFDSKIEAESHKAPKFRGIELKTEIVFLGDVYILKSGEHTLCENLENHEEDWILI